MKFLLLSILFLFSLNIHAQEVNATLKPYSEETLSIKEGDSFVAKFVVWPISFVEDGTFKTNYDNKKFLDFFHVSEVISEGFSENNSEAYEVQARLILTKFFNPQNILIWSFRGLNIPVKVMGLNPIPLQGRAQEFVVLNQEYSEAVESNWKTWLMMLACLGVIVGFFLRKRFLRLRKIADFEKRKTEWANKFSQAESRSDYELLYSQRTEWESYIPVKTPEMLEFYNIINEHQYKKDWSDEIRREVSDTFDEIRTILK